MTISVLRAKAFNSQWRTQEEKTKCVRTVDFLQLDIDQYLPITPSELSTWLINSNLPQEIKELITKNCWELASLLNERVPLTDILKLNDELIRNVICQAEKIAVLVSLGIPFQEIIEIKDKECQKLVIDNASILKALDEIGIIFSIFIKQKKSHQLAILKNSLGLINLFEKGISFADIIKFNETLQLIIICNSYNLSLFIKDKLHFYEMIMLDGDLPYKIIQNAKKVAELNVSFSRIKGWDNKTFSKALYYSNDLAVLSRASKLVSVEKILQLESKLFNLVARNSYLIEGILKSGISFNKIITSGKKFLHQMTYSRFNLVYLYRIGCRFIIIHSIEDNYCTYLLRYLNNMPNFVNMGIPTTFFFQRMSCLNRVFYPSLKTPTMLQKV